MKDSYDCIVMGGGPAGSTTAALVAEAGYDVLLLEREKFPRFHIGESLMPEVYWILDRLGVLDKMKESDFVKKVSVQFVSHTGKESQPFYFMEHDPRECSRTWQVERSKFDHMLFQNAARLGADCRDQTRVQDILFAEEEGEPLPRALGVKIAAENGAREIRSRVVVDATGQQSLIASRLGLKEINPKLKKAAIWGYYRGARREPGEHGGATIIMHTQEKNSWFWYIPLSNDITSIGVVGDHEYLLKGRGTPESVFEDELVCCPALAERLISAELVSKFHVAKEFSYSTRHHAGPGWVLTGDAFGFIDPIYSSGVYLALKSGEQAADAIIEGFANNDLSPRQLGRWAEEFKEGVHWIKKLVDAYYSNEFSFGRFMRDHPHHQGRLTDLLIGRVFNDDVRHIFTDMDAALAELDALEK